MEAFERFGELMRPPAPVSVPLDEACLLIAAHLQPGVDVDGQIGRIDDLAAEVTEPSAEGVRHHLFERLGFRGDLEHYHHPDNSLLHRVVDRRRGIPITLSVLMIEVARRLGVTLVGIGLPGHFVVGDPTDRDAFVDPFAGGAVLDRRGCEQLVKRIHGPGAVLQPAHFEPTPPPSIVARVLQNLRVTYTAPTDRALLAEVLRLRSLVPGVPAGEREELAEVLARSGRFDQAANELEAVAAAVGAGTGADDLRSRAQHLRARLN